MILTRCGLATVLAAGIALHPALAQVHSWTELPTLGGDADDRRRLGQLLGRDGSAAFLLRSASEALPPFNASAIHPRVEVLSPEVLIVHNSAMPFSLNDGALWAARGWSEDIRAGVRVRWGRFSLVLAPELTSTENLSYELPPPEVQLPRPPGRSDFSTPWHVGAYSIDLPLRFGVRGLRSVGLGQSSLAADLGAVSAGVSTENEWWGPGIRNAIVLSDNAAGIPRVFVRTNQPVRTRLGTFSARWFLGGLSESAYFDTASANDRRALTALAATWTPAGVPGLTLGLARASYAPIASWGEALGRAFDVLLGRGSHRVAGDSVPTPRRDQVTSLFGRWVLPADGFAVHAEWARTALPGSFRELLVSPNHSQGYTLGLEWARPVREERGTIRFQAEVSYLEKPPSFRNQREETWYTGRASPQGYTQSGKVIGAAIGPGASSQWLAVDYFAPTWRVGVFGGRIRWDDDALYTFPSYYPNKWCAHDISLFAGITGALLSRWGRVEASVTAGERLNVFFYHLTWCGSTAAPQDILDVQNTTFRVRIVPRMP